MDTLTRRSLAQSGEPVLVTVAAGAIFEQVLAILRGRRGLDFGAYRRGTIERRLCNRMIKKGVTSGDAYLELLVSSEDEIDALAANLTIKVSRFYRNAAVFDALRERVIPDLREAFAHEPLRFWSAGCATGEETYTLAMLLQDGDRVVGTDVDEGALRSAMAAEYDENAFEELPRPLAAEHLHASAARVLTVNADVKARVSFERHDVTGDAPPDAGARYHLVCCRNVLIYFSRPLQECALALFAKVVAPGGVLCLGEAEWIAGEQSFEVLDRRNRLFRRVGGEENGS